MKSPKNHSAKTASLEMAKRRLKKLTTRLDHVVPC